MVMTLDELKAENAETAEDAAKAENVVTDETESLDTQSSDAGTEETTATEETEQPEGDAEADSAKTEETEVESWMQGDAATSPGAEPKYTDSDMAGQRRKYRAKLEAKNEVEEELRRKIVELESAKTAPTGKPKYDDFVDADDPETAHREALVRWEVQKMTAEAEAQRTSSELKRQQEEQQRVISQRVDQHYERAVQLAQKSNITPEAYHAADARVKQAVNEIFPGSGDVVTEGLIANLGDGSEKVMYNLGVNTERLEKLKDKLREDRNGLQAAVYLGELRASIVPSKVRTSQAPAPAPELQGDKSGSESERALKRKYDAAHKKGDIQAAIDIKQEAKWAGANTKSW